MASLENKNNKTQLFSDLEIATSLWTRGKGLLGRQFLAPHHALWIHRCNSIHTFFMKFSIDCVFLDKNLVVKAVREDIKPGHLILPVWGAHSVIEMSSGRSRELKIQVGDQLYVGN